MKLNTIFLFITTIFIFSSCLEQENIRKDYSLTNSKQIIENYNNGKLLGDQTKLEYGSVEIISTRNEVLAIVSIEGKQNLLFFLQHGGSIKALRKSISEAELIYFQRQLLINSLDEKYTVLLTIDKEIPSIIAGLEFDNVLNGFGLVRQSGIKLHYNSIEDFSKIGSIFTVYKKPTGESANLRADDGEPGVEAEGGCGCCTDTNPTGEACSLSLIHI